ncbi:MAG: cytidine deaminase [Bacteroidales bacterium]|nr:cytidine deaminase [Candidatus Colimorpha onthohippi]
MSNKEFVIRYVEYQSIEELSQDDRNLMQSAIMATNSAYSPYSHFKVGAAVAVRIPSDQRLVTVRGSNQENVAYPSGLCAERTALFYAGSEFPEGVIEALAIVARNENGQLVEAAPCGACRQVLAESSRRATQPIRVLMYRNDGSVRQVMSNDLLPFAFDF